MPDRESPGLQVADAFRRLNRTDMRGGIVAGLVDAAVLARLKRYRVIRPDDLLVLDIALDNLVPRRGKLARVDSDKPGLLIVHHPLQAVAEEAFKEGLVPAKTARAAAAGPSRLVFRMPTSGDAIPFTLEGVLQACRTWELKLGWAAQPAPPPETGSSGWVFDWREAVLQAEMLSTLLAESAQAVYGQRATASLRAAGRNLARGMRTALPRGGRTTFQKQVAQAVKSRLGSTRGGTGAAADAEQQALARGYIEAVAAAEVLAAARPQRQDWQVDLADIWPYLLKPSAPTALDTAIELPYRLIATPLATAGFTHALQPVAHGGRTELWHTRLGRRLPSGEVDDRAAQPLRFPWSPDFESTQGSEYTMSLDPGDRDMIVSVTAGYHHRIGGRPYVPRPVDATTLHMTALGGTLALGGTWKERPENYSLEAWAHRMSLGRDHYVRVEYAGWLFPFGHAATLVKVTERTFMKSSALGAVAPLRQRFFVIVRDRVRRFDGTAPQPDGGRGLPFERIECLTKVTPLLDPPGFQPRDRIGAGGTPPFYANPDQRRMAFWPALAQGGPNFRFQFVGIDSAGRRIPFDTPVMLVSTERNTPEFLPRIVDHYNSETTRREPSLGNAVVRMAQVEAEDAANAELPVSALQFRGISPAGTYVVDSPRFFPDVEQARVRLPSIERLTGRPVQASASYPDLYRKQGLAGDNKGEVFLELAADLLDFGAASLADRAGGVASPNLRPTALSRTFGLGSGAIDTLAKQNEFDPGEFFGDDSAKLLGFVPLKLLLRAVAMTATDAPRLDTRELPDRLETRLHLEQADLQAPAGFEDILLLDAGGQSSRLTLDNVTTVWLDPSRTPESVSDGEMSHFKVNLFGCIVLWFDRLHFHSASGSKPEVDVDLNPQHGITFGGPLEFVDTLKDLIPANGFSDPPGLAVTPQGITASFSLELPNVQVGILALSNINLGAAFNLPFTGDRPSLRFNFAERHNTFNLTVSLFGGGGFFAIGVDTGGVNEIEAALEFGAAIRIDLGVASGGVYVKGGFYFHYSEQDVHFEGYVEMGGRLRIIGLISVSLTFHLALAYDCEQKTSASGRTTTRLYGQASLVVEVEVLFFSASVTVRVKREFAGAESDPTFADFIPDQSTWQDYCLAYA